MVSTRKTEYDAEEDTDGRDRTREPLLNPPANQASGTHFDLWGARMREKVSCSPMHYSPLLGKAREGRLHTIFVSKCSFPFLLQYGLNNSDRYNSSNQSS